jgi:hypothetical protein
MQIQLLEDMILKMHDVVRELLGDTDVSDEMVKKKM